MGTVGVLVLVLFLGIGLVWVFTGNNPFTILTNIIPTVPSVQPQTPTMPVINITWKDGAIIISVIVLIILLIARKRHRNHEREEENKLEVDYGITPQGKEDSDYENEAEERQEKKDTLHISSTGSGGSMGVHQFSTTNRYKPESKPENPNNCNDCDGEGVLECDKCDGDGNIECDDCSNDMECGKCDGSGDIYCSTCNGTGISTSM